MNQKDEIKGERGISHISLLGKIGVLALAYQL
jgi:hypothetical protein